MTTRTVDSIRYTLLQDNLDSEGRPTRAAVERLAQSICDALAAEYPTAEIRVPVQWKTSGVGPTPHIEPPDYDVEDRVFHIGQQQWERWSQALTDSDMERE